MRREGEKRFYLEYKSRHWGNIAPIIRALKRLGIEYKHNMLMERKPYPYYRHRIYVFGKEALKVLNIIEWDFLDDKKNRKLKAIKGIYRHVVQ